MCKQTLNPEIMLKLCNIVVISVAFRFSQVNPSYRTDINMILHIVFPMLVDFKTVCESTQRDT